MTSIGTKNGSLIVKDGKLAENCDCCNGLCSATRDKATLTISGLPSTCDVGNLANREISDDNCSYTLFRIRNGTTPMCVYATTWHSSNNDWLNYLATYANSLYLNVNANTLTLNMDFGYAVFSPPEGKTFQTFPFDETLVCTYVPANYSCSASNWQNVRVRIDDAIVSYKPFRCPQDANLLQGSQTCSCDPQQDAVALSSRVRSGNVETETVRYPVYACKPCDTAYYATETTTTVYKVPCTPDEKTNCIDSISTSTAWSELNVSVSFTGPDIAGFSYSPLSGSYALKWTDNAYIGTFNFFGLSFPQWTLTNVNNGIGSPSYGSQLLFNNANQKAGQGWRIDRRIQPSGQLPIGMTLVVAPVKTTTVIDRSNSSIVSTQCGFGQFAYQVKLAVFSHTLSGINSDYGYWTWDFSCFANVACAARSCGGVPSVSLNSTETVYVPTGGPWYASYGRLGQVSVSISS